MEVAWYRYGQTMDGMWFNDPKWQILYTYRQWFGRFALDYSLSIACRTYSDCISADFVPDYYLKIYKIHESIYLPMTKRIERILGNRRFDYRSFDWIVQCDTRQYGDSTWTHQWVMLMVASFHGVGWFLLLGIYTRTLPTFQCLTSLEYTLWPTLFVLLYRWVCVICLWERKK